MHPHPLFLPSEEAPLVMEEGSICEREYSLLTCTKCSFGVCFHCATIPNKVKHISESDEHFLTLLYKEDVDIEIYCEICEDEAADSDEGYYTCKLCSVRLHSKGLLGNNPFVKHAW